MSENSGVEFCFDKTIKVNSGYTCGSRILKPVADVDTINTQALCSVNQPTQNIGVPRTELEEGCVVRLVYVGNQEHPTTYRIDSITHTEWDRIDTRKAQRNFVMVFEPITQTSPLAILYGTDIRRANGRRPQKFHTVYQKKEWDTPKIPQIKQTLLSESGPKPELENSLGLQSVEKDLFIISVLFDRLVAPNIGLKSEFFSLVV